MVSTRDLFSSMHLNAGPIVRMGDDSEIQTKGIGRIDLEHGYFSDVLYVLDLATNFLLVYEMTTMRGCTSFRIPSLLPMTKLSSHMPMRLPRYGMRGLVT